MDGHCYLKRKKSLSDLYIDSHWDVSLICVFAVIYFFFTNSNFNSLCLCFNNVFLCTCVVRFFHRLWVCMFWITCSRCLMLIVNTSNHKQLVRTTAFLSLCVAVGGKSVCVCVCVLCLEHSIILLRVPLTRQTVEVWESMYSITNCLLILLPPVLFQANLIILY